jgi:hypothetical protein
MCWCCAVEPVRALLSKTYEAVLVFVAVLAMSKRQRPVPALSGDVPLSSPDVLDQSAAVLSEAADVNSPPRSAVVDGQSDVAVLPASPASNRERFRASQMPSQVSCDLSSVPVEPGHSFTFQGIVLVVFPASANPLRRHVLVGDGRGVVGLTEQSQCEQNRGFFNSSFLVVFGFLNSLFSFFGRNRVNRKMQYFYCFLDVFKFLGNLNF